ncbi:hypothetical protein ACTMU2_38090 [Cupriavidus basilensis]
MPKTEAARSRRSRLRRPERRSADAAPDRACGLASRSGGGHPHRWHGCRVKQKLAVHGLVLDTQGRPAADAPVKFNARARITTSTRKRVVGGFYCYGDRGGCRDLGTVRETRGRRAGRARCDAPLDQAGQGGAGGDRARQGRGAARRRLPRQRVTRQGELRLGGENHDRIDVPSPRRSRVRRLGDTAVFQVRMRQPPRDGARVGGALRACSRPGGRTLMARDPTARA